LLLPFKWFIIGVGEVFLGIFIVIKGIVSLVRSLFKYLFEGVMSVVRGIIFLLKDILFKYTFIALKWLILKLGFVLSLLFRGIGLFFFGIYKAVRFFIVNTFIGLIWVIKHILLAIKYIFVYLFLGIKYAIKYLFLGIKYIFIHLFRIIRIILIYIGKALKFIFIDILYKYLGFVFNALFKAIVAVLKFIIRIPLNIWLGIKFLALKISYPFIYIVKNFKRIVSETISKIKEQFKKISQSITTGFKNIKKSFTEKYNNLSFIKDAKNKRELKRQALLIDFDAESSARSEKKITYHYVAKNTSGKIEKGYLGAYSRLDVHSYLLSEGYEVYEIEPAKGFRLSFQAKHKIKVSDLVFFLTQLSTYIKAGIPLVDSIKVLGKQARKSSIRELYKSIIYDLTMGDNFSEALEKQGAAFPKLLVNMVKSSELAGNLSETLDDMANYYTSVSKTRKQMKSAMTYPTVIFVFATSVVIFLLTFVIPSFIDMYKDADAEVPALTMTIINLSDFLVQNFIFIILGVFIVIMGFYFMYKNVKLFRTLIQWMLMHTPIVGKVIIYNEVTMFAKTFASLWNHNVFITSSMEILSKITNNEIYKMLIFDAITNVARGEPVSSSFKNHWAFPVVAYEMLVTGERTGQPGPMMDRVADFYQEEHSNAVNQIKAFIEPAMIIFLAVVVGVILLSVVLPMFSIYGEIGLES
jgi:type IV pilus assembly protein PilC